MLVSAEREIDETNGTYDEGSKGSDEWEHNWSYFPTRGVSTTFGDDIVENSSHGESGNDAGITHTRGLKCGLGV